MISTHILVTIVSVLALGGDGARILGIFPYPGGSHFAVFRPLMERLALEGHSVVVLSYFPRKEPLANYTDLSLVGTVQDHNNKIDFRHFETEPSNYYTNVRQLYRFLDFYEPVFDSAAFKRLRKDEKNFDLAIVEMFNTDAFLGLVHKMGIPFIGISSCVSPSWTNYRLANPDNPSYIPAIFSASSDNMGFVERLKNALNVWTSQLLYDSVFLQYSQRIAEKYLGPLPSLSEIAKNVSLVLVNSHFSLNKVRPLVPGYVEVGGIHITKPKKLPHDLEEIINKSRDGVIYFTMGSMLRGSTLRRDKVEALMNVFRGLKQTVLWKWEDPNLPNKPDNVHISDWFPQADILAHPNVVLYISHAGLLGVIEAVHYGIPSVNIPMYGDQELNTAAVVSAGAGIRLDFNNITESSVGEAIKTVLNDPRFKMNAMELSSRYRDRLSSPLETAIFWVEYLIRHKQSPLALRSAAVNLPWYQYLLIDVIFVITLALSLVFYLLYIVAKCIAKIVLKTSYDKSKYE